MCVFKIQKSKTNSSHHVYVYLCVFEIDQLSNFTLSTT